ncbi:MAG: BatD family protein [Chitinophagales bacterium]|nr:BatD family protein [Chitinophagales bacterium]
MKKLPTILLLLTTCTAFAQEQVLQVKATSRVAALNEELHISYTYTGCCAQKFTAPGFEGFEIVRGPIYGQQTNMHMKNGKAAYDTSVTISYDLKPLKTGKQTIAPGTMRSGNGKTYTSKKLDIEVHKNLRTNEKRIVYKRLDDFNVVMELGKKAATFTYIVSTGPVYMQQVKYDMGADIDKMTKQVAAQTGATYLGTYEWGNFTQTGVIYTKEQTDLQRDSIPRLFFGTNDTAGIRQAIEKHYDMQAGKKYATWITRSEGRTALNEVTDLTGLHKVYYHADALTTLLRKNNMDVNEERRIVVRVSFGSKENMEAFIAASEQSGYKKLEVTGDVMQKHGYHLIEVYRQTKPTTENMEAIGLEVWNTANIYDGNWVSMTLNKAE